MTADTGFTLAGLQDILDGSIDESDDAIAQGDASNEPEPAPAGKKPEGDEDDDTTGESDAAQADKDKGAPPAPGNDKTKKPEEGQTAALIAERRKRQELEQEIERLKKQPPTPAAAAPAPQPKVIPQRPDPYADPQGAEQWDKDRATEREQAEEQRNFENRAHASAELVIEMKGEKDYLEKEAAFGDAVKANPALAAQLRKHPNPALFAYREGKKFLDQKELSDPAAYRAKVEAEIRASVEAELRAKIAAEQGGDVEDDDDADGQQQPAKPAAKVTPAIPQTLAKLTPAGPASRTQGQAAWSGPPALTDIIKN